MSGVFLSYRRAESDYAVLMYAWLAERFGATQVFWDREDIEPGKDFREVLSARLKGCTALVALIGPSWTPSPWIQKEIGAALKRKVLVLPVLVGETPNLTEDALPAAIRALASIQTVETRDMRFRDRLVTTLEKVVTSEANEAPGDDLRVRRLTELLRAQADHRQREALRLIQNGEIAEASDVLNETFTLLMTLLEFNPGDPDIEALLGFLYKDLATVFEETEPARATRYIHSGLQLFQGLLERHLPPYLEASAVNGLGNMHLMAGDYEQAIECCRRATELEPDYGNAWADLFLAYDGQARSGGRPNLAAMRDALAQMKGAAKTDALLASAAPSYEAVLNEWEAAGPAKSGARLTNRKR